VLATARVFGFDPIKVWKCYFPLFARLRQIRLNHGQTVALAHQKAIWACWQQVVSGSERNIVPSPVERLGKHGLVKLHGFRRILRRTDKARTLFLSMLRAYNMERDEISFDISSVTSPYSGQSLTWINLMCFARYGSRFNLSTLQSGSDRVPKLLRPRCNYDQPYALTSAGGPNGSPAFSKWSEDFQAICGTDILLKVKRLCHATNNEALLEFIDVCERVYKPDFKFVHSKLAFLEDKAGKTRVVAMVDIWTQSALKPVHDVLMNFLKTLETDCTHDQEKGRKRLTDVSRSGVRMWSFDLKNATDRLPAWVARESLKKILSADVIDALFDLMVNREFECTTRKRVWEDHGFKTVEDTSRVRYAVGTPMGSLACFAGGLSIPHHAIILAIASCLKILDFKNYEILGDDIVIWDERVARMYELVMTGWLGMGISKHKSLIGNGIAEFAKTIVFHGRRITPLSHTLLEKSLRYVGMFPVFLKDHINRYGLSRVNLSELLSVYPTPKRRSDAALLVSFEGALEATVSLDGLLQRIPPDVRLSTRPGDQAFMAALDKWMNPTEEQRKLNLLDLVLIPLYKIYAVDVLSLNTLINTSLDYIHSEGFGVRWSKTFPRPLSLGDGMSPPVTKIFRRSVKALSKLFKEDTDGRTYLDKSWSADSTVEEIKASLDSVVDFVSFVQTKDILGLNRESDGKLRFKKEEERMRMLGRSILRLSESYGLRSRMRTYF